MRQCIEVVSRLGMMAFVAMFLWGCINIHTDSHRTLILPPSSKGVAYRISPDGNDRNPGTLASPWATIRKASVSIKPGDTVYVGDGVYEVDRLVFEPPGSGPAQYTVFKAESGARPVFTRSDGMPPAVYIRDYVQVEGLWFGGRWAENSGIIALGGSPISNGVRLISCTIWGYSGGVATGSAQDLLIHGNRIIHCGSSRYGHGVYLSGGYTKGAMTQHVVIDRNLFLAGEGYAIHGWHNPHSSVITRNISYGHYWGLVYGDHSSDALIAHNVIWRPTGQPGREPSTGYWIPGRRIIFANNVIGADSPSFGGPSAESKVEKNAYAGLKVDLPAFDDAPISLQDSVAVMIDKETEWAMERLDAIFSGSAREIQKDTDVERLFSIIEAASTVAGNPKMGGVDIGFFFEGNAPNIGRDTPAWDLCDVYRAFDKMGLKHYDANGLETISAPAGWNCALSRAW